jgi:hypothetical protein
MPTANPSDPKSEIAMIPTDIPTAAVTPTSVKFPIGSIPLMGFSFA